MTGCKEVDFVRDDARNQLVNLVAVGDVRLASLDKNQFIIFVSQAVRKVAAILAAAADDYRPARLGRCW